MKRRHFQGLVAGIVLAGLLAACGSDDNSTSSTTAAATPTTAGAGTSDTTAASVTPTESEILLGETSLIGGAAGDYSTTVAAVDAAVMAINKAGGVNGHPLKIHFCDNGFDANKSAACAREFVDAGVVAQVGSTAPFGEDGITAILQAAGIPQVGDNPLAAWITAPNEFPVAEYLPGVYADVPACVGLGYKTISITGTDNAFGEGFAKILRDVAAQIPDAKVVSGSDRVVLPATATDISAQVRQVLDQIGSDKGCIDASGVFPQQEILLLQGLKTFNADPEQIKAIWGVAGAAPKDLQQVPALVKDYLFGIQMFPPLVERSKFKTLQQYVDEINAAKDAGVKGTADVSGDVAQRDLDIQAWLGVHALAKVMEQEKAYTAKDIMDAMLRVKDVDVGDIVPPWTPTKPGGSAFPRLPATNYYAVAYNDKTEPHLALPDPIDISQYLPK